MCLVHAHQAIHNTTYCALRTGRGREAVGRRSFLKEVRFGIEMRCRCWNPNTHKRKKLRMRSDGWKRCYRCGVQVPGLTLRAKWGRERMEREGWAELDPTNPQPIATLEAVITRHRIPVVWTSKG